VRGESSLGSFRASRLLCLVLLEDANSTTAYELFDVVDEEAVGGDGHVVRLEDGAELAWFFEVEEDFALAGRVDEDGVDLFEQRSVGVVERDFDAE
jgi:hypothetical protein